MFLLIYCLFCSLAPIIQYYVRGQEPVVEITTAASNTSAKPSLLVRFVVEEHFKPAIFGSFKFDPILQGFIIDGHDLAGTTSNDAPANAPCDANNTVVVTSLVSAVMPRARYLRNSSEHQSTKELVLRRKNKMTKKPSPKKLKNKGHETRSKSTFN